MSYQVFARKYRPQTFDDILGQEHVVQTLRNAIEQDRLAHAYLFVGPRGTGKTSTARILAKALNCTNGPRLDFDPNEDVCLEIAEGNSLDVLEIDGASNRGIDEVRELRDNVKFAPARGRYKIYYIDEVHMLTPQAFNALLKTLEEPPAHVKFIFATTEPTKILPTILSRCQRFDLRRIPEKIIATHLLYIAKNEGVDLDEGAAYSIARGAEGGMRDAQSMLDQLVAFCGNKIGEGDVLEIFGFTGGEIISGLSADILAGNTAGALNRLHEQVELGKDLSRLLADLISHFRNVLVCKVSPGGASAELSDAAVASLEEQGKLVDNDRLLDLIEVFADADARMKWAPNKKLHFEVGIIRAVQNLSESRISDVVRLLDDTLAVAPSLPSGQATPPAPQGAAPAAAPAEVPAAAAPQATPPSQSSSPPPEQAAPATASTPSSEPVPAAAPAPAGNLSGEALWSALCAEVDKSRPLASAWLTAGHFLGVEGRSFVIAFPEEDAFAKENVMRPNNRSFLEEMLETLSGGPLTLKTEVRGDLQPRDPAPAAEPAPSSEPPVEQTAAAPPDTAPAAEPSGASETPPEEESADDSLIREALKIFEAEIQ